MAENKVNAFFLSPKNQDRVIEIMEQLEKAGYPTDNRTFTAVLHVMREQGVIPKLDDKSLIETIKKVVPKGGKILHIKGGKDGRRDSGQEG